MSAQDEHYIRAVTELGDTTKVVVTQDIYSRTGLKLVASGVAITSDLYQRLVQHLLLQPLDMSLSMENAVDAEMLWRDTQDLIQKNSRVAKMVAVLDKGYSLRKLLAAIQLPGPLTFKLTVAREKFPEIYQHSLVILVISVYVARCEGMRLEEEEYLAVAALFHDIGLLHIDPALLDPAHRMSNEERRHLYAHPLSAYLLLREFPALSRAIADAVLEHHERMDGRGYPRGLPGDKISRYGQILAIAETSAKPFAPGASAGRWRELEVMLKLNFKQYGNGLLGYLSTLWDDDGETVVTTDSDEIMAKVKKLAELFQEFERHAETARGNELYDFAQARLANLMRELLDAGLDPHDPDGLMQCLGSDPECADEYAPLLKEAIWQFKAIVLDVSRHWPEAVRPKDGDYVWLETIESLLSAT
jgi:hypothetical protein